MSDEYHTMGLKEMKKKVEELEAVGTLSESEKADLIYLAKDKETFEYLSEKGISIDAARSMGKATPLEWAAFNLEHPIVEFLAGLPHSNQERLVAIQSALDGFYYMVKDPEKLPKLAEEGRDLLAVVKELLQPYIRIDAVKFFKHVDDRFRYMLIAMQSHKPPQGMPAAMEMMRQTLLLLNPLRNVHQKNAIWAAQEGDLAGVKIHWNDCCDYEKQEVLAAGCYCGFLEICEFAVAEGVKIHPQDATDAALTNPAAAAFLVKHVSETNGSRDLIDSALEMAIARDRVDSLAAMLSVLPGDGKQTINGFPILRYAVLYMAKGCFKLLLERGAPPYYMYFDRYQPGIDQPLTRTFSILSDADRDFFTKGGEGMAEDLNDKARPASPALFI